MFDKGSGPPIVVVPGVQGRWQWMRPALDELAGHSRTLSYSLRGRTFDDHVAQLDRALDRARLPAAAICGVSFGGMVAIRYAAERPSRVKAIVIVSTPSPSWQPTPAQARDIALPWRSTPGFVAGAPSRLWPEISAALERWPDRLRFSVSHALRIVLFPALPPRMAERISVRDEVDLRADCARITAPTLVITGEPGLDRVVPVQSTRQYVDLIRGARYVMMERTGHLGLLTRRQRFARIVGEFVNASHS